MPIRNEKKNDVAVFNGFLKTAKNEMKDVENIPVNKLND